MNIFNQFQRLTGRGNASTSARTGSQRCQGIRRNHMKTHTARAVGVASLFVSGVALAQSGNMMNSGMWGGGWMGGYDGMWRSVLVAVVVAALVVWIVKRGGK